MSLAKRSLRRLVKLLSAVLLGALIGVNGVAFMQVWAMTHFAESGERTARPERLEHVRQNDGDFIWRASSRGRRIGVHPLI